MKQSFYLLLALCISISHLFSQTSLDDMFSILPTDTTTLEVRMCAWDTVSLKAFPASSESLSIIYFGEKVQLLGEVAKVPPENKTYHKVISKDEKIGWLPDSILVPQGELVVALRPMRIYKRPATPSTITSHLCTPGERLILAGPSTEWGAFIVKNQGISGWIQDPSNDISKEIIDIELANMMAIANITKDSSQRRKMWHEIIDITQQNQSEMNTILLTAYTQVYPKEGLPTASTKTSGTRTASPTPIPRSRQTSEEFWDKKSEAWLTQIQESGPVHIKSVDTEGSPLFQAAHKSLQIGTKVLLAIPKQQGYVEVEITDSLPEDSPYLLGLSQQMADLFFGVEIPAELSIFYVKE